MIPSTARFAPALSVVLLLFVGACAQEPGATATAHTQTPAVTVTLASEADLTKVTAGPQM